jgi:hypothetical protein
MKDPEHAILPRAFEYEIIGLRLEREPSEDVEPYLDLTLRRGQQRRILRFWSPQNLEVERGGPTMTHGLVIYDIRARGLDRLTVEVDDFEASDGKVRFVARAVEELSATAG